MSTRYQKSIRPDHVGLFKYGRNNAKLGGIITKGDWKGMPIYSLTLIERETCPSTCYHWDDCYGNHMPFAHRFKVEGLEKAIPIELAKLSNKYPKGFVIRLHVLGDFYSPEYVKLWQDMLISYPKMRLYGYSARKSPDPIYKELWLLNIRFSERVKIRFSHSKAYDSLEPFTIYAGDDKSEFDSITCPEQTGKTESCSTCGLCWGINKSIKFVSH